MKTLKCRKCQKADATIELTIRDTIPGTHVTYEFTGAYCAGEQGCYTNAKPGDTLWGGRATVLKRANLNVEARPNRGNL